MKKSNILWALLLTFLMSGLVACSDDEEDFAGEDSFIGKFELTVNDVTYKASITGGNILMSIPHGVSLNNARANVVLCENATIEPDPAEITNWDEDWQFVVSSYSKNRKAYTYRTEYWDISAVENVILATQEQVNAFSDTEISTLKGNLIIGVGFGEDTIRDLSPLNKLKEVSYKITINNTYVGKTLAGLDNLEKVGALEIINLDSLTDIYLPKLNFVGMGVNISCKNLETVNFPELISVSNDFIVKGDHLVDLAFPKLKVVEGNILMQGTVGTANTANTMELLSFPCLEKVTGDMLLKFWPKVKIIQAPLLNTVAGLFSCSSLVLMEDVTLPALTMAGSMKLEGLTQLRSFNMPELQVLTGSFTHGDGLQNLDELGMPKLQEVRGSMDFGPQNSSRSKNILSKISFPELTTIGGDLTLPYAWKKVICSEVDFPKLRSIGGTFNMTYSGLSDLNAFASLESIKKVNISDCNSLTSLVFPILKKVEEFHIALKNVKEIDVRGLNLNVLNISGEIIKLVGDDVFDGDLTLSVVPELAGFKVIKNFSCSKSGEFPDIVEIKGELSLTAFSDFPNLKKIGCFNAPSGSNFIAGISFPELEEITGYENEKGVLLGFEYNQHQQGGFKSLDLPKLKKVTGNFTVGNLSSRSTITGINAPLLETITGVLDINSTTSSNDYVENSSFTDLSGFAGLKSVGGVTITRLKGLTSFRALKNVIGSLSADAWNVSECGYNPTYEDMVAGKTEE